MNQYAKTPKPPRPYRLLLTLLLVLLGATVALGEGAWPDVPPPFAGDDAFKAAISKAGASERRGYYFAAGLYRALERSLAGGDARVGEVDHLTLLLRALVSQGREGDSADLLAEREDFPLDLRLLGILNRERPGLSDLERERWREVLSAEDGETLYWRARLENALGDSETARATLRKLMRREPGSVFASAALELLESLPLKEIQVEPPGISDFQPFGYRVQWGVFRDPLRARRQREAVAAYGQAVEILPFRKDGTELYRVCSPPFNEEAAARESARALQERYGLDFVIHKDKPGSP